MIPREVIREIRAIEIVTRRLVNDQLAGQYHSVFRGRGMAFDEVRQYQPGDDIRTIDWNVSARMNDIFIKQFVEERELTVVLLVDASASLAYGSQKEIKREVAAKISALLAFSAISNNDKVGLVIFTDQIELFVPPKKGRKHVLRVITEVLTFEPKGRGTSLSGALEFLSRVSKRRTVTFVISDFLSKAFELPLRVAHRKHDLIPIVITDPTELELPRVGLMRLEDLESGDTMIIDTASYRVRQAYAKRQARLREEREAVFRRLRMDCISIRAGESYVQPMVNFFKIRASRMARV